MCYIGCKYEYKICEGQGACSLHDKPIPKDAFCIEIEKEINKTLVPNLEDLEEYDKMMSKKDSEDISENNNINYKFYKKYLAD